MLKGSAAYCAQGGLRREAGGQGGGDLPGPGQQVVLLEKGLRGCGQAAPGAWCRGQPACGALRALPPPFLLLPLAAALLHFKEHPREGVPREACSPVAAVWRGRLYSCQADREELTLPTRLVPRPPPAGLAHTLTRSAPLEAGQAGPAAC